MSDGELFQDGRSREQRPGPLKSETPSRKPNRRNREAEHGMPTSVDQVLQLLLSTAPSSVAMGVSGSTSRLSAGLPGQLAETGVGSSERARSRGPGDLVPSVPPRRGRAPSPVEQLGGDTVALDEALVRATERAVVSSTMANLQLTTTKKVASYYSEASKDLLLKNDALQETLRARDAGDSAIARYYREQLLDAMRESNKKLRDFQSSCESTALSTEARLAQQEEEIAKRDTRISEMEGVMAELQQELRGLETYVVERENIKQLLASQQQKYEEEIRKLQEEIASLRFGIIEEKVRVRADSKERESSFEKLVNERAVELLESTTAQIHSENIALREEKLKLGAEIQAALESCEALRRANAELRRRVSLAEDIEQRYATRGAKQSNEIKMLREQVAEMEKNMAAIVNEAKKSQSGVRVAANQRVEELQASRDEARSTAAARTRELAKLRAASKHLVRQRSDVETFLISALTEVRLRIAEGEATTSAGRPVLAQKRSCPQASATAGSSRVIPTAVPTLLQAPTAPKIDGYASELRMITCKGAERPLLLPPPSRGTSNREPSATREMPRLLLLRDSAAASLQSCRHGEVRAAADEMSVVPAGPRRQVPLGDSSGRGPGASLPRIAMSTAAASASALQGSCRGSSSAPHTGHTDADAERNEGCQRQGDDSSYQLTVFPERREESILPQTFNISDVQLCDIRCMSWSDMERVLLLLFRNLSGRRRREPEQAPMLRTQERRASYPETGPPPSLNAVASSERPPTPQVTGSPAGAIPEPTEDLMDTFLTQQVPLHWPSEQ